MNNKLNQYKWNKIKKKILETWCEFSDQEVELIQGKVHRLAQALETKYGTTPEEARLQAELFRSRFDGIWPGNINYTLNLKEKNNDAIF